MIIKIANLKGEKVEYFNINLHEKNYLIVKCKLILIKEQIVNLLKKYKKAGIIKSERRPKNKKIQPHLNDLIKAKRDIVKAIELIRKIYK